MKKEVELGFSDEFLDLVLEARKYFKEFDRTTEYETVLTKCIVDKASEDYRKGAISLDQLATIIDRFIKWSKRN